MEGNADVKSGRDQLTEIYNFQTFTEKLSEMLHENPDKKYVLIIWDIERFKVINDLFGMETANKVLIEFADALRDQMLDYGIYGRLGGDIFACSFERKYLEFMDLERKMIMNFKALHVDYKVISQAGVYYIDNIDTPVYQMCDRAKLALKTIKGKYDKRYAIYDKDMREELLEEQEMIMDLERGLQEHQFFVEIQPIYELDNDRVVSGEALVRWNHPVKGVMSPGRFIPVFERNGMITRLDAYVWEETCRLLHSMKVHNKKVVPVSVNVSRLNLFRKNLCEEILALIQKYDLDTSMLRLEITESAYVDSPEQLNTAIQRLQRHGFKILMDDFGSGYSSLNMLKDLSFDILKVDMRFLDDLDTSDRAVNVVTSIVRMAKWLGMVVVAEGVEKRSQAVFLKSIGCDRVQGYYFSRPLSEGNFKELVQKEEPHREEAADIEHLDLDSLLNSTDLEKRVFMKELMGALALYEIDGDKLDLIKVNDNYYQLFETTPQQVFEERLEEKSITPQDQKKILECCIRAYESKSVEHTEVCRRMNNGSSMWLHLKTKYVGCNQDKKAFYISISDITKYHNMKSELRKKNYSELLCNIYQEILELDYTNQTLSTVFHDGIQVRVSMEKIDLYEGIQYFAKKRIVPEEREKFIAMYTEESMEEFCMSEEVYRNLTVNIIKAGGNTGQIEITTFKIENEQNHRMILVCSRDLK